MYMYSYVYRERHTHFLLNLTSDTRSKIWPLLVLRQPFSGRSSVQCPPPQLDSELQAGWATAFTLLALCPRAQHGAGSWLVPRARTAEADAPLSRSRRREGQLTQLAPLLVLPQRSHCSVDLGRWPGTWAPRPRCRRGSASTAGCAHRQPQALRCL